MLFRPLRNLPVLLIVVFAPLSLACGGSDDENGGADSWRIGLEAPLSADQSAVGGGMLDGAQLAAAQLNAEGGLVPVRLTTKSSVRGSVRGSLGAYAYPREIEFVEDLPKTLTGKIGRIELRER